LLEEVIPDMGEVGLLRDALAALEGAFLVVVVGEFNSGKSTVINALLGGRARPQGLRRGPGGRRGRARICRGP
jgi:Tfp pilus assembly ATPase PilU